jgi:Core-2/I-Branching enzyme
MHFISRARLTLVVLFLWTLASRGDGNAATPDDLFAMRPCPSHCQPAEPQPPSPHNTLPDKGNQTNAQAARIFYLVLVHNERTVNDAIFLFRAIRSPLNIIVIHFDQKIEHLIRYDGDDDEKNGHSSSSVLLRELRECPCGSRVRVDFVHSVEWSKWSMNLPTLWGMQLAVSEYTDQWDVFINLSGDTLPVYTTDTMATLLGHPSMARYNFVTSRSCETGLVPTSVYQFPKYWHKRRHYTRDETEDDPVFTYSVTSSEKRERHGVSAHHSRPNKTQSFNKTVTVHFGSQWVILRYSFVEWLVRQLQDESSWPSQFREYLIQSEKLMTDETFIPTVLMHARNDEEDDTSNEDFSHTIPTVALETGALWLPSLNDTTNGFAIRHVRFERMDEHMPTSYGKFWETQRYQVPDSSLHRLEQPKVWGPYFLGVYDLGDVRESGALFVRKVSALLDPNMVNLLPVDRVTDIPNIHWPFRYGAGEISLTDAPNWQAEKQQWSDYRKSLEQDPDNDEEL